MPSLCFVPSLVSLHFQHHHLHLNIFEPRYQNMSHTRYLKYTYLYSSHRTKFTLPHRKYHITFLVCIGICCQQGDNKRIRVPITINLKKVLKEQLQLPAITPFWSSAVITVTFYELVNFCKLLIGCHYVHQAPSMKK